MITSNQPVRIKGYLFIDHCAEGICFTRPKEGEILTGYPHGWFADNSAPFIEHSENGKVTKTINCADLAIIEF